MKCCKCDKIIIFEKIIDQREKKAYHIQCWSDVCDTYETERLKESMEAKK